MESTRLMRSFSHKSCVAKQGDPIRFLGESISFGRFMSESLAWEKWSAFSHNRYVEEAVKISKPGSVAEKKAYFESHFRRKAAQKPAAEIAAPLIQEANGSSTGTFDPETQGGNCNGSAIQTKLVVHSNSAKDAINYEIVDYASTNDYRFDAEQSEVGISKVERAEHVAQPPVDTNLNVDNSILVDNSNQFDNIEVHEKFVILKEEMIHDLNTIDQKNLALPVQRKEINSSPKLSSKTRAIKLPCSAVERKATVPPRDKINNAPKIKKTVGDSAEKNRPSARSLHMSVNFRSHAGKVSRIAPVSEHKRVKTINSNLPHVSKDRLSAPGRSNRTSNGVLDPASTNPQSGGRRTEKLLSKSVSVGVTANGTLPTLSVNCLRSLSNTRSPARPFRFKTEERAAKRKEFFQRMDEIKSKEAEKTQRQKKCKEKAQHSHRKLLHRNGITPSVNKCMNHRLQLPSNEMRKISLTRPQSPQLVRKASSGTIWDNKSKNSWKPPIISRNSKLATGKVNQTTHSFTSMTRRNRRENACPNIQH